MTTVFMFPGQSSRYPEMIGKVIAARPSLKTIVDRASEIVGLDVATLAYATNRDVQIGVFLANYLHEQALALDGVTAQWSLGLSLGEYNHLVHIGALTFEAALRLVDARGRLYDRVEGGLMVSVFPIEAELVDETIAKLGLGTRCNVGLYNSPRQQVISGERAAVEATVAALEEAYFIQATPIEPRIPMHAIVFEPTANALGEALVGATIDAPKRPYVANARGAILDAPSPHEIRSCLIDHAYRPVYWQKCVEAVAARVGDAAFIEVGPKSVLSNMFGRGWTPGKATRTDGVTIP